MFLVQLNCWVTKNRQCKCIIRQTDSRYNHCTDTLPLARFLGPRKNHAKEKLHYRRCILALKPQNREYESSKSSFSWFSKLFSWIFHLFIKSDNMQAKNTAFLKVINMFPWKYYLSMGWEYTFEEEKNLTKKDVEIIFFYFFFSFFRKKTR